MALHIRPDDLRDPRVALFLEEHLADMRRVSPPECVHALDLAALRRPEIRFWCGWLDDAGDETLVATAALKRLDAGHAELKSMRTAPALRGQGVARHLLAHVLAHARAQGVRRLSLETGVPAFFAPAHRLYLASGFVDCGPFGDYRPDPFSRFMSLAL